MTDETPKAGAGINTRAAWILAAVVLAGVAGLVALQDAGGLAEQCEEAGGHYLVGRGGETACVDRGTLLMTVDLNR
jgi:hypothetical protein